MPSLFEGLSVALIEAMAAGLPVIVSDAPAQRELLGIGSSEPAGVALPISSPESWARVVMSLLEDEAERRRLITRGRRRAADFGVDVMARSYEGVLSAVR